MSDSFDALRGGLVVSVPGARREPAGRDAPHWWRWRARPRRRAPRRIRAEGSERSRPSRRPWTLPVIGLRKRRGGGQRGVHHADAGGRRATGRRGRGHRGRGRHAAPAPGRDEAATFIATLASRAAPCPCSPTWTPSRPAWPPQAAGARRGGHDARGLHGGEGRRSGGARPRAGGRRSLRQLDCPVLAEGRYATPDAGARGVRRRRLRGGRRHRHHRSRRTHAPLRGCRPEGRAMRRSECRTACRRACPLGRPKGQAAARDPRGAGGLARPRRRRCPRSACWPSATGSPA